MPTAKLCGIPGNGPNSLPNSFIADFLCSGSRRRAPRDAGREAGRRQAAPAASGAGAESHRLPPDRRPDPADPAGGTITARRYGSRTGRPRQRSGLPTAAPVQPRDWLAPGPSPAAGDTSPRTLSRSLHAPAPPDRAQPPTSAFTAPEEPSPGKIDLPTICPQRVVDGWTQPDSARSTTTAPDQHLCWSGAVLAPGGG